MLYEVFHMSMYLNSVAIPDPKDFDIAEADINKTQRTSSGRLLVKWIATKKRFTLSYPFIRYSDMAGFFSAFNLKAFFTFIYYDKGNTAQTATVSLTDASRKLLRTDTSSDNWLYDSFQIVLEEQ